MGRKGEKGQVEMEDLGRSVWTAVSNPPERDGEGAAMMDGEIQSDRVVGCCCRERDRSRSQ